MARFRNIGWWTSKATSDVIEAWEALSAPARHQVSMEAPALASALHALAADEAAGCPRCPTRYPVRHLREPDQPIVDPDGNVIGIQIGREVGWRDVNPPDEEPDDWWPCHLEMGHIGPHRHENGCSVFEWGAR